MLAPVCRSTAYANGGPVAVVWYWWIPGVLANLMALSLAEIASSFPVSPRSHLGCDPSDRASLAAGAQGCQGLPGCKQAGVSVATGDCRGAYGACQHCYGTVRL